MIGRFFVFAALVCSVLAFSNYKSALGVKDYKGTDGVCNCIYAYSSICSFSDKFRAQMEIAEVRLKANKNIICAGVQCDDGDNKPVCQSLGVRSYPYVVAWYKGKSELMPAKRGTGEEIRAFCVDACARLMA